ncbi:MAG: hypothetical protein FJW18_04675 [Actinobacteria bacterium]|nr:hypothetical protein [Actinomycetota bacterium]
MVLRSEVLKTDSGLNLASLSAVEDPLTVNGELAAFSAVSALVTGGDTVAVAVIGVSICSVDGRAFELVNQFGLEV